MRAAEAVNRRTSARLRGAVLVAVGLVVLGLALAAVVHGTGRAHVASVPVSRSPRVCFPVGKWGPAPDRFAPCVRIRRIEEDGSFTYAVSDRDGTVRYSAGVGALDR